MPDILFQEKHGANVMRRLLAGVVALMFVVGGWAYLEFSKKTYESEMSIISTGGEGSTNLADVVGDCLDGNKLEGISEFFQAADLRQRLKPRVIDDGVLQIVASGAARSVSGCDNSLVLESFAALVKEEYALREVVREEKIIAAHNKLIKEKREELAQIENKKETNKKTSTALSTIEMLQKASINNMMPDAGWHEVFSKNKSAVNAVSDITQKFAALENISEEIKKEEAKAANLKEWIEAPENAYITLREKKVVHYEDTPALVALKDKKAAIEASRMRMLRRATTQNPKVIQMSEEIDELQEQINALTRRPQVVEDIVRKTNPKLLGWRRELVEISGIISGFEVRKKEIRKSLDAIILGLQKLSIASSEKVHANKISKLRNELYELETKIPTVKKGRAKIYAWPGQPVMVGGLNEVLVYAVALFCGFCTALLILYSRRKTKFVLTEPKPEFPVLGRIAKFDNTAERLSE